MRGRAWRDFGRAPMRPAGAGLSPGWGGALLSRWGGGRGKACAVGELCCPPIRLFGVPQKRRLGLFGSLNYSNVDSAHSSSIVVSSVDPKSKIPDRAFY